MTHDQSTLAASRRRMVVFWLASGTSFFLYLHRYTWNVIRPELQKEYGFSNTTLEAFGTAFYATYAFGSIPTGIAADFYGPHIVLTVIILAWAVILPFHGLTGNVYGLGFVRLLFGAAQTGGYPALGQVTRSWFPRSSRTRVQGWVASFFGRGGGAMSSLIMATVLMGYLGLSWRVALIIMAIPGVIFGLIFCATFRNTPEEDPFANEAEAELIRDGQPAPQGKRELLSTQAALKNFSLRVMVVQQFLNAGADVVYTLILGSFFASLGVADMKDLGWMISLPLIGGAVGGIVGGILNDWLVPRIGRKWGRSSVGMCGKFLAAISLWISIIQPTPERVAVGLFFVKFFTDWTQPTVWGTSTDLGGRFSGTVFSIINTGGNIGGLVMPLIFGPLLDFFSTKTLVDGETVIVTSFTPMFLIVGLFYVGAGVCWALVDCRQSMDPTQKPDH
ncbi:MAG: MFS transporter [Planctomycetaceae bacterium]|nr:MFS transporter [Planctomycetaceae bacterium]